MRDWRILYGAGSPSPHHRAEIDYMARGLKPLCCDTEAYMQTTMMYRHADGQGGPQ